MRTPVRYALALALAAVGYLHAQLYRDGYRAIPTIGSAFLLLASASFAVALLTLVRAPLLVRLTSVPLAAGALGGFLLSRTVGVAGFVERGLQPSPQALESLVAEIAVLLLAALDVVVSTRRARSPGLPDRPTGRGRPHLGRTLTALARRGGTPSP